MTILLEKIPPQKIPELTQKCIWFLKEEDIQSPAFVQLDWNMCGGLSRGIKNNSGQEPRSLIPTLKRISAEYIMIESSFDFDAFAKACTGMKFETVAIVCTNENKVTFLKDELAKKTSLAYPQTVTIFLEDSISV